MLLITPTEIVDIAFTGVDFISPGFIKGSKIEIAQERFLRPAMGSLYDAVASGKYPDLVETYIKPPLAYFVRHSIITDMAFVVNEDGVMLKGVKDSESVDENSSKLTDTTVSHKSRSGDNTETDNRSLSVKGNSTEHREDSTDDSSTDTLKKMREESRNSNEIGTVTRKRDTDTTTLDSDDISVTSHKEETTVTTTSTTTPVGDKVTRSTDENDTTTKSVNGSVMLKQTDNDSTNNQISGQIDIKDNDTRTIAKKSSAIGDITKENTSTETITDNKTSFHSWTEDGNDSVKSDKSGTGRRVTKVSSGETASAVDREILRRQALSDANILLAKAMRYIEANAQKFPEYDPEISKSRTLAIRGGFII